MHGKYILNGFVSVNEQQDDVTSTKLEQ